MKTLGPIGLRADGERVKGTGSQDRFKKFDEKGHIPSYILEGIRERNIFKFFRVFSNFIKKICVLNAKSMPLYVHFPLFLQT